jgi:hypothetical protein
MNDEYKEREKQIKSGLTTAALAGVGERTAASGVSAAGVAPALAIGEQGASLLSPNEAKDFRARWDAIQVGFVNEPRRAVEQADNLVAGAMKRLAEMFADERAKLEGQWDCGDHVSTEDLRLALRRYRSFFGRLLSI